MAKTLHILNGDVFFNRFSKLHIGGDTLIWREMLCEGPLHPEIGSDAFWMQRYDFFKKEYRIEKLEYFDKTIKEIQKIEDINYYDEVVLWFEDDLFCQINMLGAASYLLQFYRKDIRFYLVCPVKKYFSDLSDAQLSDLYERKTKLSRNDLLFADKAWREFAKKQKEVFQAFDFGLNKKFRCLKHTIKLQLNLFPDESGLNRIEKQLINWNQNGIRKSEELVQTALHWQKGADRYGFSDMQYRKIIENLTQKGHLNL